MKTNITETELLQIVNELKDRLETKDWTLIEINANNSEDGTIWDYQIKVPGICFSEAEKVIEEICYFWDFNRMDDTILKTSLDYIEEIFNITWEVYC